MAVRFAVTSSCQPHLPRRRGRAARATRKSGWESWVWQTLAPGIRTTVKRPCLTRLMRRIQQAAHTASEAGQKRGAFPAFTDSRIRAVGPGRSAQVTSVAPTELPSLIAGTTAGIEPMFAIVHPRHRRSRHLLEVNPCFDHLSAIRAYRDELIAEIAPAWQVIRG